MIQKEFGSTKALGHDSLAGVFYCNQWYWYGEWPMLPI